MIVLYADGLVPDKYSYLLDDLNDYFTMVFTGDMGLKLLGLGLKNYLNDRMNIFDTLVNILSLFDLFLF
jgi:hypothetical protein